MATGLNLAGKTYDVYVRAKGRWLLDSHHSLRSAAMAAAEELLENSRGEGVRVVAENSRTGDEEVVLEEVREAADKGLTIIPVDEAPGCDSVDELLSTEARRTAGRLLRNYLADQGITALELAFDHGRLRLMERMEKLFAPAMQRIGTIQARTTDAKPHERVDVLYRLFAELKDVAQAAAGAAAEDAKVLADQGPDALAAALDGRGIAGAERERRLLAAFAAAMAHTGSMASRIDVLTEALGKTDAAGLRRLVDGILAEVLDRPDTVAELLAAPSEAAKLVHALAQLASGQCAYRPTSDTLTALDAAFQGRGLEASRATLLARVALVVGGTKPLTRSGVEADREAFEALLGDLVRPGGLGGGSAMAVALVARVRNLYRPTPEADDLDFKEALTRLLSYMPSHAVRIGLLLDLLASSDAEGERGQAVVQILGRLVQRLDGAADLVPPGGRQDAIDAAIADLRARLESESLPGAWRAMFAETLDRLVGAAASAPVAAPAPVSAAQSAEAAASSTVSAARAAGMPRRQVAKGTVIFEEGSTGEEAYLIAEGSVEVFRVVGGKEVALATLGKGQIVGEMSLIDNAPRMASARAVGDTRLVAIARDDLRGRLEWLAENDKVLRRLIDVFVARLRSDAETAD